MTQHFFLAPADMQSPRWRQAFPSAQVAESMPPFRPDQLVWLMLTDEMSFIQIRNLTAEGIQVIAMTALETQLEARLALEAGASGYVHYFAAPEVLEQVAQVVLAGGMWLGANLMRQLVLATARVLPPARATGVNVTLLTSRERAVAELVAAGKSNKEIARELAITERTVKAHLGAAFEKLRVRDRLQLVLIFANTART